MREEKGAQTPVADARNEDILIWLNGRLVPRAEALVSVFDAGFGLGDGVWEGIRLCNGELVLVDEHLKRLYEGAHVIAIDIGMPPNKLKAVLEETVAANGMTDGVHIRLMVTRGEKRTVHQDPRNALGKATIVVVAEHKQPDPTIKASGIKLATSAIRCSSPDAFDLRLNSHSRLNLIQALQQIVNTGAHEALMLDPSGFVSSCNSTNFFIVRNGKVLTSTGRFCFKGITRSKVIELCSEAGTVCYEQDFTLSEVYGADEAFVTGTFGALTPVYSVDGRVIGDGQPGQLTRTLSRLYEIKYYGTGGD